VKVEQFVSRELHLLLLGAAHFDPHAKMIEEMPCERNSVWGVVKPTHECFEITESGGGGGYHPQDLETPCIVLVGW
jgi:hypothetical protein